MSPDEARIRVFAALAASPLLSQAYLTAGSPIQTAAGPQQTVRIDLDRIILDSTILADKLIAHPVRP